MPQIFTLGSRVHATGTRYTDEFVATSDNQDLTDHIDPGEHFDVTGTIVHMRGNSAVIRDDDDDTYPVDLAHAEAA